MDVAHSLNTEKLEVSTPFIRGTDIAELAKWPKVIAALTEAYAKPIKDAMVPPRIMARGEGFWLRSLCAVSPSGEYMGCKLIAASPKIRRASYLISLFDQRTMELAALLSVREVSLARVFSPTPASRTKFARSES
jgi:ornithine cyclodeaminase/alanine dehydrogenase-like protein (mu-crystallin family)